MTLLFFLHVMAAPGSTRASIRYVRTDGVDAGNNCANVADPCATIQHAVDTAVPGDEVWVAGGTYSGVQVRQTLTQHLYISQSVTIRGGYTPLFDAPPDPQTNPTTLDAAGLGRVVVISGSTQVSLVGLELINGNAGLQNGGGLYADDASLVISGTTFLNNRAEFGGGFYSVQAQLTMQHSQFLQNAARLGGGGARLYGGTAVLHHNTFSANTTGLHGGGLYITAGNSTFQQNQITGNTVTGASQGWGGGLHLSNGQAAFTGNVFSGNQAHTGGGLRLFQSQATLDANLLQDNWATMGGGLSLENQSTADLTNNVLLNNTAVTAAALQLDNARATFKHTTFAGNGDGIVVASGQAELVNSIMASQSTGIMNAGGAVTLTATLWDAVGQPTVGLITQTGGLTGTAAFAADGYHLTAVSDAIDNGMAVGVAYDIDELPRPVGSGFDLGAVEWRDLTGRKTVQPETAVPGQVVTYTIVLTAPAAPGTPVWLTDTLPAEVTFIGPLTYSAGSGGFSSGVITWTGVVFTDTAVTLRWPVQLSSSLPPGTNVANTAVIQTTAGIANSTTAVVTIPAKVYLPLVIRP